MADTGDWRLAVQHEYLRGAELAHRAYRQYPENPDWDHDHCKFCWHTFNVTDMPAQLGYCTLDEYHWICAQCYLDFHTAFGWTVVKDAGNAV